MKTETKNKAGANLIKVFFLHQDPAATLPTHLNGRLNLDLHYFVNGLDLYQYLKCGHEADALVLDVNSQAFALINLLQQDNTLKKTPVVLVAESIDDALIEKAKSVGVDDVFQSGILDQQFLFRLNYLFKKYQLLNKRPHEGSLQEEVISDLIRLTNILVASTVLLITSPLFAIITLLSNLSSNGSVFKVTTKLGANNKIFNLYTFQTFKEIKVANQEDQEGISTQVNSIHWAGNYLIPISQWINQSPLHQMPKLLNVLKGDLSLIPIQPKPLYWINGITLDEYQLRFAYSGQRLSLDQLLQQSQKEAAEKQRSWDKANEKKVQFWQDLRLILKNIRACRLNTKSSSANQQITDGHQVVYS